MTVTKAALARELGIDRSRLSQMMKRGLPTRRDGLLDRTKVLEWLSGQYGSYRGRSRKGDEVLGERVEKLLNSTTVTQHQFNKPLNNVREMESEPQLSTEWFRGACDVLRDLLTPSAMQQVAEDGLAIGIELWRVVGLVSYWRLLLLCKLEQYSRLGGADSVAVIEQTKPVDWDQIAAFSGEKAEIEAWLAKVQKLVAEWEAEHGRP